MALAWPPKDPDEILDYGLDWSKRVKNDPIESSEYIVPEGLTKLSETFDKATSITWVWLKDGELDASYTVLNRIVTEGGRKMDQSVKIKIQAK